MKTKLIDVSVLFNDSIGFVSKKRMSTDRQIQI